MDKEKNWYALYTKPRCEFKAEAELSASNIENYLPAQTVFRQWSDRKKKIKAPLFSSYIFINADEPERLNAVKKNSIVTTVSFRGKPSILPDWEIDRIKKILAQNTNVVVNPSLAIGREIVINAGPLMGMKGIVIENSKQFFINVEMLNRSISVKLDPKFLT